MQILETDDVIYSTQFDIEYINEALNQFSA